MKPTKILSSTALVLCLLPALSPVLAQRSGARIDSFADEGALPAAERISGLGFRFRPSAGQSTKLERLLQDQQNPASPRYHAWLTPEEYGEQFGISRNDLAHVSQWLEEQGFHVESTARSRTWITFSGTAGQVRAAFKTEVHRFRAGAQLLFANVAEAQIPAPLKPLIHSLNGLNSFGAAAGRELKPGMTFSDGSHGLSPGDLATIYNMRPLLEKGFDGSGQKIAVVGASAINLSDIQQFRDGFDLPANDPQLILAAGSADPGKTWFYQQAVSDVEIAGASAPKASILYVYSGSPLLAAQYAVDQNLAPVITYTFDTCEKIWSRADVDSARAMIQQANAQGITWIASSGNTGAAGCEIQGQDAAGSSGPWVTIPAAFPEVTAVGGTMFAERGGDYWSAAQENPATARSYIPETAWNSTALGQGLSASGGGASMVFPMPAWQNAPGVPKVNARLVPDISFAAASDHDPYLIIANGELWAWGGTSSSASLFAGVVAILNQYLVSTGVQNAPGLGNINPRLYELARTAPDVFHDITTGDNIVPCKPGTSDCLLDRYGYGAGPGYDAVTGLGSLDVEKFVVNWPAGSSSGMTSTFLTITASPATVDAGASTTVIATVKATAGTTVPTGTVTFRAGQKTLGDAALSDASGSAVARLTVDARQLAAGRNIFSAQYAGTAMFSPSTGSADVTVTGGASVVVVSADPAVVYKQSPDADGYAWHYRLQLADTGGMSSVVTELSIDGADYTDRISSMFGGSRIPAYGSLTAALRAKITSTPVDHTYTFGGVDTDGNTWRRQITIRFLAEQGSAAISLSSSPSIVRQSPQGDPRCSQDHPLYHQMYLQELNGIAVRLNKFVADGKDVSAQIEHLFGSSRLPAFGSLRASLCWTTGAFPVARDFEVAGIDANGQPVRATVHVTFKDGVPNPGTLTVSKKAVELSAASGTASATLDVDLPSTETWTASVLPANQKTRWLAVSPTSGRGPAQVRLTGTANGLTTGAYTATLVFQSEKTVPQVVSVPVVFLVGNPGEVR